MSVEELSFERHWRDAPVWPEHDPEPFVKNYEPRPEDAPEEPASVKELAAMAEEAGWDVRVGYSLALVRGTKNSTYRLVESFGVWLGPGHRSGWRASAVYRRFKDAKQIHEFDGTQIRPVGTPAGKPGTWTWGTVTVFSGFQRHHMNVSDLKAFIAVRGSVLTGWFVAIAERISMQKQETARKAKERPKKAKEGAN